MDETLPTAGAFIDHRSQGVERRGKIKDRRETSERRNSRGTDLLHAQLRDANERLVITAVRAQELTEIAEQARARMAHMAGHDALTGLPNRMQLTDRLTQAIALAKRHRDKVALLFIDIDHFKHINDSLGHLVGDQLLQSLAKRLKGCVRHSDTVSRQGGDEFVVLLSEATDEGSASHIAEKLIAAMICPHLVGSHSLHVTLSIGLSIYPDDGTDIETLLRSADTAMYQAKKNGRNNYQRFTPDMNEREMERQSIEGALRHGIEHGEFVLHYQPVINLETGAVTGAEALLRLRQDAQKLMPPLRFVTIAEESGLIVPIGRWVLREACRQTKAWQEAGLEIGQIAVNVSSIEFHNKAFLGGVRRILNDTGLDPHCLELELTESGLMQNTEMTIATLLTLKEMGVRIAIDDFGTGYSSLSYLRHFPVDTLKIDQSFVKDIDADEYVISAIIAMGRSLKQRVVAEGIESSHQLDFLRRHLCTEGQGYYLNRPVAANDFAALLLSAPH
jgi:diguanylate cyclase (GGDEF)-like protein